MSKEGEVSKKGKVSRVGGEWREEGAGRGSCEDWRTMPEVGQR